MQNYVLPLAGNVIRLVGKTVFTGKGVFPLVGIMFPVQRKIGLAAKIMFPLVVNLLPLLGEIVFKGKNMFPP